MIGLLRLTLFGFVGLTVVYFSASIYSRSVRREKLEDKFDAGGIEGERHDYVEAGMRAYEKGLKRRLLWLVYIIPTVVFWLTVYFVNYQ